MIVYENYDDEFKIIDYSITHSQLLIRSMSNTIHSYNIDLLFKVVKFMMVPDTIRGVSLSVIDRNPLIASMLTQFDFPFDPKIGDRVFCLTDKKGTNYYLVASAVFVFYSNMDRFISSLGRYDMGEFKEEKVISYRRNEIERFR